MMKKRILLITQGFPYGNSEKGFLETEYAILCRKYDVWVISCTAENSSTTIQNTVLYEYKQNSLKKGLLQLLKSNVRKEIGDAWCLDFKIYVKRIKAILSFSAKAEEFEDFLEKTVSEKSIDLIYTFWCLPETLAALHIKEKNRADIKVVTRFHGYDLYAERRDCNWQPFQRKIVFNCDRLVFACRYAMDYLQQKYKYSHNFEVSYLGSKQNNPRVVKNNSSEKIVIVSCSNIVPLKRVNYIAEAISLLPKDINVEWHHIGGPITDFDCLDDCLNVKYKIWGNVNHDEVYNIYNLISPDVFITATTTEGGVPVSIQEAFSYGIPAIGPSVGGVSEIIRDGYNGFLLQQRIDVEDLKQALMKYFNMDKKQKSAFSNDAFDTWKNYFDATINAEQFGSFLDKCFDEK